LIKYNRKFIYKFKGIKEIIRVDIDFYGREFLISENGAKLYFSKTDRFFYFLDFEGNRNSVLYCIYSILPIVPMSYKDDLNWFEFLYFSPNGILKNYISFLYSFIHLPYKKFNLKYGKKVRFNGNLSYLIYSNEYKLIFSEENFLLGVKRGDNMILEQINEENL
jgi:hypothetical protein